MEEERGAILLFSPGHLTRQTVDNSYISGMVATAIRIQELCYMRRFCTKVGKCATCSRPISGAAAHNLRAICLRNNPRYVQRGFP
jgi:hypothetical protein